MAFLSFCFSLRRPQVESLVLPFLSILLSGLCPDDKNTEIKESDDFIVVIHSRAYSYVLDKPSGASFLRRRWIFIAGENFSSPACASLFISASKDDERGEKTFYFTLRFSHFRSVKLFPFLISIMPAFCIKRQDEAWLCCCRPSVFAFIVRVSFNVITPGSSERLGFVCFLVPYMWAIYREDFHSNEPSGWIII